MEGAEPKMPGAPGGIQIMTPQQFVAKAGDMPGEEVDEGVRDLGYDAQSLIMKLRRDVEEKRLQPTPQAVLAAARELAGDMEFAPQLLVKQVLGQGVAEGDDGRDKHYYLRNDIWRVMDGDELVYEYKPERYEVVGAKKLLARFDDEGYDVTHVISPMGTVTYLYGKPDMDEGAAEGKCVECGGPSYSEEHIAEAKDACYNKVKSRYKVWPSAYASGALVKCRKVGASNWGNKSKK